jgi:8-oxo-dGTP pyrophosphatase MutT (NUDIX family)
MTEYLINPWKTQKVTDIYENKWIKVTHEDVITPTGTQGIYGKVHFKNIAIGIIPIDEAGNTWLVGQYRYVLNKYSWEIVEGGGPLDQDPLESAKRELAEEVGLAASRWEVLAEINTSNSVTDEYSIIYIARGLTPAYAPLDETELLQVRKLPLREAVQMAMDGTIMDSISVVGLLKAYILLGQNEI